MRSPALVHLSAIGVVCTVSPPCTTCSSAPGVPHDLGYCQRMDELPPELKRPDGVSDQTVEAVDALTLALETVIRARGALYELHQLTGKADNEVERAVDLLRQAGAGDVADEIDATLVGRNVNHRRWTFQIVEDYDATYYEPFVAAERAVRNRLIDGRRHQREAEMKRDELTPGSEAHGF